MEKKNNHFDSLLKTLAQQGDSSAFLSLAGDYLKARYQKERENGSGHPDARTKLLAEATELFEQFQAVPAKHIDAWFEEHCRLTSSQENEAEAVILDKNTIKEAQLFIDECTHELLRTGSQLKKKHARKIRSLPYLLIKNPVAVIGVIAVAITGVVVATGVILSNTGQKIRISLIGTDTQKSITFPFMSKDVCKTDSATVAPSDTAQKAAVDTILTKDSIAPVAEKPALPAAPSYKKAYIPPLPPVRPQASAPRPQSTYTPPPQSASPSASYSQQSTAPAPAALPVAKPEIPQQEPAEIITPPAPAPQPAVSDESGRTEY